jgi:alcohol dehydrogenase
LLIAYGGLLAMDFRPGETLLVSGATGNFGSATVALAMAMGARCVVAPGRDTAVLDDLRRRFGERLIPVRLSGDGEIDTKAMRAAAPGPIDAVQDFLPPSVAASVARAAIMTLRQGGRAVLMGGVGMLGGEDLALPYPWIMRNLITVRGQWMYDTAAISGLVGLVRGGVLDLGHWALTAFPLVEANDAVAHAAANAGPFKLTVLKP